MLEGSVTILVSNLTMLLGAIVGSLSDGRIVVSSKQVAVRLLPQVWKAIESRILKVEVAKSTEINYQSDTEKCSNKQFLIEGIFSFLTMC